MVVTVDGPSGAGKSTVSRRLAAALGFAFLDTGALYRGVALAAQWAGIPVADEPRVAAWLTRLDLTAQPRGGLFLVLLEGRDVEPFIRNEEVAGLASRLSAQAAVRAHLLGLQRQAGRAGDLVAEGRDMGSVVFPRAEAKFFLTASPRERARRRWRELSAQDPSLTLAEVEADLSERDRRDTRRSLSPLQKAADALLVDSTAMDLEEVIGTMLREVRAHREAGAGRKQPL